ncbi:MAG: NADH-quinone oxidoreductase subunit H [Bacillota bacterium]|nr:NADH-quinone oxidoreductase subunit H [Bacillota bacterium]
MVYRPLLIAFGVLVLAPLLGGLLTGFDRWLSARLQARVGPPLWQPFADLVKLWHKDRLTVNVVQILYANAYLLFVAAALAELALGHDLLMLLFTLAFGTISLVLGGFSVRSPYSRFGAQREIMQLLAYEPILVLMVVAIYLRTGSFLVSRVVVFPRPLLPSLPLIFLGYLLVVVIKLRKSPFDLATSLHHPHQELVKGILTDYSGPYLGIIELAHWYELVLLLGLAGLFWATSVWAAAGVALLVYLAAITVDNVSARVTWAWMLRFAWQAGLGLAAINVVWLYLWGAGMP